MEPDKPKNDPQRLMSLAKSGDQEAFADLYQLYFVPIYRYIYTRVKDREVTNDLTQSVFLKVYTALPNFEEKNHSPLAYFFTVARNIVIDYWRSKKEVHTGDQTNVLENIPDNTDNPLEVAEAKETRQAVREAIQSLTVDQQEVINLKFMNGLSNREVSRIMERTEEAIRQLQCRAIQSLRQILLNQKII
jgi:RNA polymerase sigma-70 factor (ECF subfamily)